MQSQRCSSPHHVHQRGYHLSYFRTKSGQTSPLLYIKLACVVPGLLKDSQRCCPPSSADGGCLDLQGWYHFMAHLQNRESGPDPPWTASSASAGSGDLHPRRSWLFAPGWVAGGKLDLIARLLIWVSVHQVGQLLCGVGT